MKSCLKGKIDYLENIAHRVREDLVEMFYRAGRGHIGGSLSCVEVLVTLYYHVMRVDPENPAWEERDRFVLSKGHAAATLYAVLANKGFFSKELLFSQFIKLNGILEEHPDMQKIPGVDMSAGALGQGLSAALGMSLAARVTGKNYRVYVIVGDGEMQSGQIWEALMAASHYKLSNLTVILDYNRLQVNDYVDKVMGIEPVEEKCKAFGWNVLKIDGHNITQIVEAFQRAKDSFLPTFIISHSIKGKGIPFMEGKVEWHSHDLSKEDYQRAKMVLKESTSTKGEF